ncbi:hypothetical protein [Marilutibacter spongiae]|uniref:Lipoprotein n=1 Tax=Marilutibacter spongiae TaxID=2025720 RepID=A0A7W3TMT8_9GAMM|nr:hypothetical protein [Lysobacter spongiae]MBB1060829.1 hypothetical protein [Lysobacter spongiae]
MKALITTSLAATLMAACVSTTPPAPANLGPLHGMPPQFQVLDRSTGSAHAASGPDCQSPLVDPRDGTRLVLMRSNNGAGDYRPDSIRYGLTISQLLRVDCHSGRPLGAVPAER